TINPIAEFEDYPTTLIPYVRGETESLDFASIESPFWRAVLHLSGVGGRINTGDDEELPEDEEELYFEHGVAGRRIKAKSARESATSTTTQPITKKKDARTVGTNLFAAVAELKRCVAGDKIEYLEQVNADCFFLIGALEQHG
ncbi:unnamed protein product, partial [Amoebophrya sp. A25]